MNNEKYIVEFNHVSKLYNIKKGKNKNSSKKFYALKDINFKVEKGEVVGILGTNGSGKSTLSNILSGIVSPDEGEAIIRGEQALIAIKSGLNNNLTGIENIEFKGALLGFSKKKIEQIKKEVIEFSELGDFINQPVKSYSSGMKSRLGFSISINIDADIIIIDEALSVGDTAFNEKCFHKIQELKNSGKTIFFVSHSLGEIKKYCSKAIWIEGGVFQGYDDVDVMSNKYATFIREYKQKTDQEKKDYKNEVYKNRVTNIKIKRKRSKFPYIASIMCLMFISVFSVGFVGSMKADIRQTELEKDYNYIFISQGGDIEDSKGVSRPYIKDAKGEVITDITYVSIKKEGNKVEISKLPNTLQYYYKEKDVSDEISLFKYMNEREENLEKYFEGILNINLDHVYILDSNKVYEALNLINVELVKKKNTTYWNIDNEEFTINEMEKNSSEMDYVNKIMLDRICSLNEYNLEKYIENITNSKDYKELLDMVKIIGENKKISSFAFKNININTEIISIKELVEKENSKLLDIQIPYDSLNDLLAMKLVYMNSYKNLDKNIYFNKAKNQLSTAYKDQHNEEVEDNQNNDEINDEVNNNINNNSNIYNNSSSGNSNIYNNSSSGNSSSSNSNNNYNTNHNNTTNNNNSSNNNVNNNNSGGSNHVGGDTNTNDTNDNTTNDSNEDSSNGDNSSTVEPPNDEIQSEE